MDEPCNGRVGVEREHLTSCTSRATLTAASRIAFTGIAFSVQGGGRAYVDSGRDLIIWSPTTVTALSSAGPSADLCEALDAAIG